MIFKIYAHAKLQSMQKLPLNSMRNFCNSIFIFNKFFSSQIPNDIKGLGFIIVI